VSSDAVSRCTKGEKAFASSRLHVLLLTRTLVKAEDSVPRECIWNLLLNAMARQLVQKTILIGFLQRRVGQRMDHHAQGHVLLKHWNQLTEYLN
jgi:hypothetical protein